MDKTTLLETLAELHRQSAEMCEVIAYQQELLQDKECLSLMQDGEIEDLGDKQEFLLEQINDMGKKYTQLETVICNFDEPAFNLLLQGLGNLGDGVLPDYVKVVKDMLIKLYNKGVELKHEQAEWGGKEESL